MISPGSILIKNGTLLPEPLGLASNSASLGWSSTANHLDGSQLKKASTPRDGRFLYGRCDQENRLGLRETAKTGRALKSVLAAGIGQWHASRSMTSRCTRSWECNGQLSGHSRHIQEGMLLRRSGDLAGT